MNISAAELERMVRDALASVLQANQGGLATALSSSVSAAPASAARSEDWICADGVVGLESLRSVPKDATSIRIHRNAVVTPAAKDWMKERRIQCVRITNSPAQGSTTQGSTATTDRRMDPLSANASGVIQSHAGQGSATQAPATQKPQRLLIAGIADWLPGLSNQLCPQQTKVDLRHSDDTSSIRAIAAGLRAGHRAGMAIVESPHAALWQMARDDAMRPAVVSHWMDLNDVLREVPTNVLILSVRRWTVAGAANVARRFLEHQRSQS